MISLIGKWKIIRDGSDFLPGLDTLQDGPLALKLLGINEVEFFKIEKVKSGEVEEIHLSYVAKNVSHTKTYQLGTINYELVNGSDVILASIQNCADNFQELVVQRLGPKTGQNRSVFLTYHFSKFLKRSSFSREIYQLDPVKDVVKLTINMTTGEGTFIKIIKFLGRFDRSTSENIAFSHSARSNGWRLFDFWPSTVLTPLRIKMVKAVKVKSNGTDASDSIRITNELWRSNEIANFGEIDWSTIPRHFGGKSLEPNEEFVVFIMKVDYFFLFFS
jgi:hypothetical protein